MPWRIVLAGLGLWLGGAGLHGAELPAVAESEPLRLTQPRVTADADVALVSFSLENAFDRLTAERLRSGLATRFTYRFQLMRDRQHWWDALLAEATVEVTAMYNAVTQEYLVNTKRDGRLVDSRLARSAAELEAAMARFENVPLFSVARIGARTRLLVRGRAELGTRTLLSFIPVRVGTAWVESRKFFLPRE